MFWPAAASYATLFTTATVFGLRGGERNPTRIKWWRCRARQHADERQHDYSRSGGSPHTQLHTKRILIDVSHAIERFALAADPNQPLLVIALFQRWSYFRREVAVYREIASRGAVTVIGFVADSPPELPEDVQHRLLLPSDLLAREWSVTVLGPQGGATLVAVDQESISADSATLEQGRQFLGQWSFDRHVASVEALRLRSELGLPAATVAAIDHVLAAVSAAPEPPGQGWCDAPIDFLAGRAETTARERDTARAEIEKASGSPYHDKWTGLPTLAYLERWTFGLGVGTLSIGLVALRLTNTAEIRARHGVRVEVMALQTVARCLQELITDSDRVVRLGREDFLLVLPSWPSERVLALSREAQTHVDKMGDQFPFVTLGSVVAVTVTRDRPLPVAQLMQELEYQRGVQDPTRLVAT